jgi:hypothetical protein
MMRILPPVPYQSGNALDRWLLDVVGVGVDRVGADPFVFTQASGRQFWGCLGCRVWTGKSVCERRIWITREQRAAYEAAMIEERRIAREMVIAARENAEAR